MNIGNTTVCIKFQLKHSIKVTGNKRMNISNTTVCIEFSWHTVCLVTGIKGMKMYVMNLVDT